MNTNFNLNFIPNPYDYIQLPVDVTTLWTNPQIQRIVQVAIPYLTLYQPTALITNVGLNTMKSWSHVTHLHQHIQQKEWNKSFTECLFLATTVTTLVATFFQFRLGLIAALSTELCFSLHKMGKCFQQGHYREGMLAGVEVLQHSLYLASVVSPHPAFIVASIVNQIAMEGFKAYQEIKQGHYLEGCAYLLLCGIRGVRMQPYLDECLHPVGGPNTPAQELTLEETQQLLADLQDYRTKHPEGALPFAAFLKERGYATHLANANFKEAFGDHLDIKLLNQIDFSDTSFTNCQFGALDLADSQFKQTTLKDCHFNNGSLQRGHFKQTLIDNSQFQNASLDNTSFNRVKIKNSYFISSNFLQAQFDSTTLENSTFLFCNFSNSSFRQGSFTQCELPYTDWQEAHFEKMTFKKVSLSITLPKDKGVLSLGADFLGSRWKDCHIDQTFFNQGNFKESQWQNCVIQSSDFSDAVMAQANLQQVAFKRTNLDYLNLYQTKCNQVDMQQCHLTGTCFLEAAIQSARIHKSDLTDCLFCGTESQIQLSQCTDPIITRPVMGLACDLDVRGVTVPQAYEAIKQCQAIPMRVYNQSPDIDLDKLQIELQHAFQKADLAKNEVDFYSIPDHVLSHAAEGSEIQKIRDYAHHFMEHVDGIVVPGGSDLEPGFYGKEADPYTSTYDDNGRRSLFELALFQAAHQGNCPIVGICRGAQVGAVYHGGALEQYVENQFGYQDYKVEGGILKSLVGDEIKGLSMHHQGIIDPGHLTATVHHDSIIKALEHPNGKTYLFQFHIEYSYHPGVAPDLSPNNAYIFPHLGKLAADYRKTKKENMFAIDGQLLVA